MVMFKSGILGNIRLEQRTNGPEQVHLGGA